MQSSKQAGGCKAGKHASSPEPSISRFHFPTAGTSSPFFQSLVSTPKSSMLIFFVVFKNSWIEPQAGVQSSFLCSKNANESCCSMLEQGPILSKLPSSSFSRFSFQSFIFPISSFNSKIVFLWFKIGKISIIP